MQKASMQHHSTLSKAWTSGADDLDPVLCVASSPSRGWLAVATTSCIAIHSCDTLGTPTRRLTPNSGSCTALCFSHDSETLLSVSSAVLGFWSVDSGQQTAETVLDGDFTQPREPGEDAAPHSVLVTVSRHCTEDRFAVGLDRNLLVVDLDGKVTCKFGPFESSISGLEWGPSGHLYARFPTRLLTTSCDEKQPLLELHAEPNTALSVSTQASFLALGVASSTTGFQVHVWRLAHVADSEWQCKDGQSNGGTIMKGVITLNDYDSQVTCMAWDEKERYLATSDGNEATIWDISEAQAGRSVMSVVCCGHSPKSRIEHMAFQPNGSYLATVGSDGRVLLFDSKLFMGGAGGVISPAAAQQICSPGCTIAGLEWLSGGKLVAATAEGVITALQLGAAEPSPEGDQLPEPAPIVPPALVSTSEPLPPATPTEPGLLQEATPQNRRGKQILPRPVLLDEEITDGTEKVAEADEEMLCKPKLEIKTDAQGASSSPEAAIESTKSCNLSPLTPKFTPSINRFTGKDSKETGSTTSDNGIALHDSLSSLSPQGSVEVESSSSAPKPVRTSTPAATAAQALGPNRPAKLRAETFASEQSPRAPAFKRTSENGGLSGPRRTYSQDSYPRALAYGINGGRSHSWVDPGQQRQGGPGLDRSNSLSKVPPRSDGQTDGPPRTSPLSPGLLQHIQAVKDNPQAGHSSHRSDLSGWGPGPLSPMPASAPPPQMQYMMPFGQQMGGGQMAPVFVPAHGPPPYGYYPIMGPPGMGPPPMIHNGPPIPSSPSAHSQPGTPGGRVRGPAPPPVPPPQGAMRVPSDFPGPRPVPAGPMMFVPAGAQPPQGWAPVMVPPPGWVGMYGQPPFLQPAPHMPPLQDLGEDTFEPMPPFTTPFPDDSVGIRDNPQVRWAAGYRSAPTTMQRDQLSRGGHYYSKQPAPRPHNCALRPNHTSPNNSSPGSHTGGKAEGGSSNSVSEAGSTGDNCSDMGDKVPPTPTGTNSSFGCASPSFARGFSKPTFSAGGLLMSDGQNGEPPHPVTTLYVGNLPAAVDEYTLMTSFQFFGQITNIQVIRDKNSAQSRGFAFVTFAYPQAATNAQSYMNGMTLYGAFGGRSVRVGPSNRASSLAEE